jgi:hypothetical protein
MTPGEVAEADVREDASSRPAGESGDRRPGSDVDEIDLDALAVKILELMRRELRIELERQGRTR